MSEATLLFDAAFALATSVLYAYVGRLVLSRETPDDGSRTAIRMFAVWWFALAGTTVLGAVRSALAGFGFVDFNLHIALAYMGFLPLVALLWGLVYYLVYIYTGNAKWFMPITVLHVAILAFLVWLTAYLQPTGVLVKDWSVEFTYAREIGGALVGVTLFTILGPALLAAIGYATLYFRTTDPTARYRIACVSGGFILWFGTSLVAASIPALGQSSTWPVIGRLIGLVATLIILAAYSPPRFIEERLGVTPLAPKRGRGRDRPPGSMRPFPTALRAGSS